MSQSSNGRILRKDKLLQESSMIYQFGTINEVEDHIEGGNSIDLNIMHQSPDPIHKNSRVMVSNAGRDFLMRQSAK